MEDGFLVWINSIAGEVDKIRRGIADNIADMSSNPNRDSSSTILARLHVAAQICLELLIEIRAIRATVRPTVLHVALVSTRRRTDLFNQMRGNLTIDDIKTVLFELGIDYESVHAPTKESMARESILLAERAHLFDELSALVARKVNDGNRS